ncbi:hypothetical protein GQX73_g5139 [Xylaria multiplex]|uniref:Cell wall protein n=1 Tax=Xylaria multiplex TaxID=323545 RepID=A0A7C8IS49_9PEZI|nr:hypothetical protein GQX73_g5139 [Xylaria multiplex]
MKVTTALVTLAAGAAARPDIASRNATTISTITGLLSSVYDAMANANNRAVEYVGGEPVALRQAGFELIRVIGEGVETAEKMQPLTPEDVITVSPLSTQLSLIGAKFLENLSGDAKAFEAIGYCGHVHQFTVHLAEVSNKFFTATKAKYPASSQEYAQQEISAVNARFARAEAELSPPACVDPVKSAPAGPPRRRAYYSPGEPNCSHKPDGNGSHPAQPSPKPVTGSGDVFAASGAALALALGVALML